jgi:hypothetical protein
LQVAEEELEGARCCPHVERHTDEVELDSSDLHYRASSMLSAVDGDLPVAFEQLVSWDRLG